MMGLCCFLPPAVFGAKLQSPLPRCNIIGSQSVVDHALRLTFTTRSAELQHIRQPFKTVSVMRSTAILLLLLAAGLVAAPLPAAGPNEVKDLVDAGVILPFEPIKSRVVSETSGEFVGSEFDASTRRYRFRFLVNGNVFNVDVDARTGRRLVTRRSF